MEGADRVREFIAEEGLGVEITVLGEDSTRTSTMAAGALGRKVAQIAKSIVFACRTDGSNRTVVVVLSGDKRVDKNKLKTLIRADSVKTMGAEEVKESTGYMIGGVPPFPHNKNVKVIADSSLFRFETVYAAAGSSSSIMPIEPKLLTDRLGLERGDLSE